MLAGRAAITVRDAEMSDFRCFYEGGRLVRLGLDPYDGATWAAATRVDIEPHPPCAGTFYYPLWTAIAMVPLSILPLDKAAALWEIALLACACGGIALLARTWRMAGGSGLLLLLLLWSEPMFSAIANAQFGPLLLLALAALALALERGRDRLAAVAWCLLLVKPNVMVLVLAGMPLKMSRRFAAYAVVGAIAIAGLSLAIVPTWPVDAVRVILGQRLLIDLGLATLWSLAIAVGLSSVIGTVAALLAWILFMAAMPRRQLAPRELVAAAAAASFLITPYARPHDAVALAVCWAGALASARLASPRIRASIVAAVIVVALVLPWSVVALSRPLGLPGAAQVIVILATSALTAFALRQSQAEAITPLQMESAAD
jgi:hypothetical protein